MHPGERRQAGMYPRPARLAPDSVRALPCRFRQPAPVCLDLGAGLARTPLRRAFCSRHLFRLRAVPPPHAPRGPSPSACRGRIWDLASGAMAGEWSRSGGDRYSRFRRTRDLGRRRSQSEQCGGGADELGPWPRLTRTRNLIESVSDAVRSSGMSPLMLTDAAASEANAARMQAPRLVVFATHGKFLDRSPRIRFTLESLSIGPEGSKMGGFSEEEMVAADPLFRSMLVLAGANRSAQGAGEDVAGDGLLTAYEVWGLDLEGTELVALTACETGLGVVQAGGKSTGLRQPTGEVVAGLRQAFMVAGVRSTVMSMWPVPLGETVRLFEGFFRKWPGGGESRYASFRDAQLDALRYARQRRGSGHPFWWAGFVFLGDPGDREVGP